MNIETGVMFQALIHRLEIKNWDEKKEKLMDINEKYFLTSEVEEEEGLLSSYNKTFRPAFGKHMDRVREVLSEEIRTLNAYFGSPVKITPWFQRSKQVHNRHDPHTHHGAGYSHASIIYLNYDAEYHNPTIFFPTGARAQDNWHLDPAEEGWWYFWESWIPHAGPPGKKQGGPPRDILSINIATGSNVPVVQF